jgi:hypothetical protein
MTEMGAKVWAFCIDLGTFEKKPSQIFEAGCLR